MQHQQVQIKVTLIIASLSILVCFNIRVHFSIDDQSHQTKQTCIFAMIFSFYYTTNYGTLRTNLTEMKSLFHSLFIFQYV